MDHRATSQEASPNGHQKPESAAPAHTPTPWREWDVMNGVGKDEYPEPHVGDIRLVGSNDICIGVVFGGYASLPECERNAAFIVKAVNTYASNTAELRAAYERIAKLEADLHECREYIEQEVDVVDGDYGEPAPNRAMQLVSMIDESLNGRVQ